MSYIAVDIDVDDIIGDIETDDLIDELESRGYEVIKFITLHMLFDEGWVVAKFPTFFFPTIVNIKNF